MENFVYLVVAEETNRGVKAVAGGYVEMVDAGLPTPEFEDKKRQAIRGENTLLGPELRNRMSRGWSTSVTTNLFTEAGTVKGIVGTMIKHSFGAHSTSAPIDTSAYAHIMYPSGDPFAVANLGDTGLTFNYNYSEDSTIINHPYVGAWITGWTLVGEPSNHMTMAFDVMGQKKDPDTAEIGSVVFPNENLRLDWYNTTVWMGAPAYTGVAPNYTDIDFSGTTQIKPDAINVSFTGGIEPIFQMCGVDYKTAERMAKEVEVSIEMTFDFSTKGIDSINEFNSWLAAASTNHFGVVMDTGTLAGAATATHKMIIDIPDAQRVFDGTPEFDPLKSTIITLKYEGNLSTITKYPIAVLLQNSAISI